MQRLQEPASSIVDASCDDVRTRKKKQTSMLSSIIGKIKGE
jgi:hypothetical protein